MTESESKILMLLGMHRSGTSLTANWLHHCGLNFGEEFIKTDVGNTEGYYEDQNFVSIHKGIFRSNNYSTDIVFIKGDLQISQAQKTKAQIVVKKRKNQTKQWAWKDPRTCLFLDFWSTAVPEAKILAVFRHYDEVVDSLIRRKAKAEKKRKNVIAGYYNLLTKKKYRTAKYTDDLLKSWISHNKAILNFLQKKEERDYLLIDSKEIPNKSREIFNVLQQNFGFDLKLYPFDKIYKENLMNTESINIDYSESIKTEAENLYIKLNNFSKQKI